MLSQNATYVMLKHLSGTKLYKATTPFQWWVSRTASNQAHYACLVWLFQFIFRCWKIYRSKNQLKGFKAIFNTSYWSLQHLHWAVKTTKLMKQVSSSDSHSLIFSYSEISELKAKTSEWPRFTNIRRNYTNVLSTEKVHFCARFQNSPVFS